MLKRFIERPVLSTVISVLIVLLGLLGLVKLPIAQYPDISPPTVQVSANYAGANADVVLKSVIVPLEQQINGVQGMTYITSSATIPDLPPSVFILRLVPIPTRLLWMCRTGCRPL
jgi:HAE1 family hydrophobic/amphiphilic exporter-1